MQRQCTRMCMKGSLVFFCLLLALCGGSLLISQQAHAAVQATYYVSPTGSDSNSGTSISSPFATVDHARQVVEAINGNMTGDIVVYLLGGTYSISNTIAFTSRDSGTNGHNIIYEAYPGQTPVLSGGTRITGWTLHDSGKNIWQASIPAGFDARQLYINGVRARRAQGSALPSGTTVTSTGYVIPNTTLANLLSPKDLEFVYNGTWVHSRCDVTSISATSTQTTVTMNNPCFQIVSTWYWQALTLPSYLENAYEFLASPGDWSIDTTHHLISYIPRSGENLATADAEVGNTQTLVSLNGTTSAPVQHLVFQGLTFTYTGWLQTSQSLGMPDAQANLMFPSLTAVQHWTNSQFVTPGGGSTWNGIPYGSVAVKMPGAVEAHAALNVQFLTNTFTHLGAAGLDMDGGSQNDAITGNVFQDISGNGLQFGGVSTPNTSSSAQDDGNTTITNNYLSNADVEYQGGVGMFLGYVDNTVVSHNEVSNVPYSGISLGWGWGSEDTLPSFDTGNIISNNYVHSVMQVRQDGGCIYTLGPQPNGSITGNFCSGSPWQGVYMDQGTTGESVTNNVFEHVGINWLNPNPNSFDSPGNTANGNYTDSSGYGSGHTTVTNTTVFSDNSVPAAAQAIIANAGLQTAHLSGYYTIVNVNSGMALDISGGSTSAGALAVQNPVSNAASQQWQLLSAGSGVGSSYSLVNHNSGLTLDVPNASTTEGTQLDQQSQNGGTNQQWQISSVSNGVYTISSLNSSMLIDVYGRSTASGAAVVQWPGNGGTNQQWQLIPVPASGVTYQLVNHNSGKVLDVNGASTANGGQIIQYTNHGGTNQQWKLVDAGGGYFNLVNVNSGLLLEVPGSSTSQGTQLDQWSSTGGANQQWHFTSVGGGYYTLTNRNSGDLVDVQSGSTADSAPVIQWPGNGGANQQWSLLPVG